MAHEPSTIKTGAGPSTPKMTREEIAAVFDRRQKAYEDLDAAMLAADYADHAVVQSPTAGTHQGRAAIEAVFRAWFDAFVDVKAHSDDLLIDGARVAQLLRIEGTDLGGFMGMPPSGKSFQMAVVCLYDFDDRLIVRERRIYDFTGLLVQIGVLKAKPA
jgi:steroid delta-isomerase-like uncharacterized protein